MLINLLPDFFAVLQSADPVAAYHRYYEAHRHLLGAYWHNYVIEPSGPHFNEVVRETVRAHREDLRAMLERTDVVALATQAESACAELFEIDSTIDVVLMTGVGAANAGELVVNGRGVAFVCLEHFTSVVDPATRGLGLDPELIPMWLAHEIAHCVRYTSPKSGAELRRFVAAASGFYIVLGNGALRDTARTSRERRTRRAGVPAVEPGACAVGILWLRTSPLRAGARTGDGAGAISGRGPGPGGPRPPVALALGRNER